MPAVDFLGPHDAKALYSLSTLGTGTFRSTAVSSKSLIRLLNYGRFKCLPFFGIRTKPVVSTFSQISNIGVSVPSSVCCSLLMN